jgi:hypothetical protein
MSNSRLSLVILTLVLCGCVSAVETTVQTPAGPVSAGTPQQSSPPAAACVQDENRIRNCLMQCDRRMRAPTISRCGQCAPGDAQCRANDTCEMMEQQRQEREDKRCRTDCTKPANACK